MKCEVWADPNSLIGASDAGAHVDQINTFAITTQLLGEAVRERGLGIWDVYSQCRREGSLDSAIEDAQLNDLASLKVLATGSMGAPLRAIAARFAREIGAATDDNLIADSARAWREWFEAELDPAQKAAFKRLTPDMVAATSLAGEPVLAKLKEPWYQIGHVAKGNGVVYE